MSSAYKVILCSVLVWIPVMLLVCLFAAASGLHCKQKGGDDNGHPYLSGSSVQVEWFGFLTIGDNGGCGFTV